MSTIKEQVYNIRDSISKALKTAVIIDNDLILDLPVAFMAEWTPGYRYIKGNVFVWKGIKYHVLKAVTAKESQPPDTADSKILLTYKPYQDRERRRWVPGEYIESGMERIDQNGDIWRVCHVEPNTANTKPPSDSSDIWERLGNIKD